MTVAAVPVANVIELPGRVDAVRTAEVRARVDGIVEQRLYTEGSDVGRGAPLFRIDSRPLRASLDVQLAAVARAQADRYKDLLASNAVSKQASDNAVAAAGQAAADVASAKAAVALARLNLGYTQVAAPIAGRTSTSLVTQGAYVQAGQATLLTTILQLDPIYVDLTEASAAGLRLRAGSLADPARQPKVSLTLEDGSAYPLPGRLEFSGTSVDPGTGSVKLRAVFANPKGLLLPGMYVRARVEQGKDDALLVPAKAVAHDPQGRPTVLVVDASGKVGQRVLQASTLQDGAWVVTGGLNDGERVIVAGLQQAKPGMTVRAVDAASGVALASTQP